MRKYIFWGLIFLSLNNRFFAGEQTNDKTPLKSDTPLNSLSWENKKFSIGAEAFSGVGGDTLYALTGTINILQVNIRTWLNPNFQLSLHANESFCLDMRLGCQVPVLLNAGYGEAKENRYWYIEGGGGIALGATRLFVNPLVNISTGVEWLISKNYSVGFNIRGGVYFSPERYTMNETREVIESVKTGFFSSPYHDGLWAFINLSITANLNY